MNDKILRKNCRSKTFSMIRNSIHVLLFAFCFIMTGCEHEAKDEPEPEHVVEVSFTIRSLSGSSLKSAANSAENFIEKIILFGVDDQNQVVQTFSISATGSTLTIPRKIKSLYAIANPSPAMEAASSVSDLTNMVGDFTNAPQSPFLMSGKSSVSGNSVNIELIRVVAKINIIGENGFQITSVTVMNTTAKGYIFSRETLPAPSPANMVDYTVNNNPSTIYIAENSRSNPIQFIVSGQLQGKPKSHFFTLERGGQNIDILRNTSYQVSIRFED